MSILPPPTALGFPRSFKSWRRYQDDALMDLAAADERFLALVAPTGSGKSLTYMAYSVLSGAGRVCILTSTRALQDQIGRDFDVTDIRGQSNYLCTLGEETPDEVEPGTTVAEGPCHFGTFCEHKDHWEEQDDGTKVLIAGHGCPYYDRLKEARSARVVVTNYSYWLACNRYAGGLGFFDLLVCDEAHAAPDELAGFLGFNLSARDCRYFLNQPLPDDEEEHWRPWMMEAMNALGIVSAMGLRPGSSLADAKELNRLRRINTGFAQILALPEGSYLAEKTRIGSAYETMSWDVVSPAPFAEDWLWLEIPKIVLSSATVREKTMDLLGIPKDDRRIFEYPSTFPVRRRPVWVIDGAPRLNYRTQDDEKAIWADIIDSFIGTRMERGWRGIVHTVSYKRAQEILGLSRHSGVMMLHKGADELKETMERFARTKGAVLVSPSATTGLDFPYEAARYQVISKLPYPDMRSTVLKARMKLDPEYPAYIAAQVMVQASGRVCRAEDDYGETVIVDGNYGWFMSRYASFTPRWWRAAVRRVPRTRIPPPPHLT